MRSVATELTEGEQNNAKQRAKSTLSNYRRYRRLSRRYFAFLLTCTKPRVPHQLS